MSEKRQMGKAMLKWGLQYKRQAVKRGQTEVATEIARKKTIEAGFMKWVQRYRVVS